MTAQLHSVRLAIYLSVLMVILASTAVAATKYASANVTIEAIITMQYLVCTLLCLPRILRPGLRTLRTERLGLHLLRGLVGVVSFYLFYAAVESIPMMDAMMLRQSAPLTVPLVLWVWSRENVPRSA
jgi:drug/metabolite transporter (DMT)-like permease